MRSPQKGGEERYREEHAEKRLEDRKEKCRESNCDYNAFRRADRGEKTAKQKRSAMEIFSDGHPKLPNPMWGRVRRESLRQRKRNR